MLVSIDKILKINTRRLGLGEMVVFQQLTQQWDALLSLALEKNLKRKTRPNKIKNKVLVVDCLNSVWASELCLKEERILKEIKKRFKELRIEKIRFIS